MPADPDSVRALAESYTAEELRGLRKVATDTMMEGGTSTRNYEGSSMTISVENAQQIIANCNAALDYLATTASGEDPGLTTSPINRGIDFRFRRIR
jgi:hypothetical protein